MAQRERVPVPARREQETGPAHEEKDPAAKARDDKLKGDLDELLDEVDKVLEENAEDFVRSYVQKGGQ